MINMRFKIRSVIILFAMTSISFNAFKTKIRLAIVLFTMTTFQTIIRSVRFILCRRSV